MKPHNTLLFSILLMGIVLISSCTNQATQTPPGQAAKTLPAQAAQTQSPSGCTSPYDGTWKGAIADSGSLDVSRPPDYTVTHNPFTTSYDLEVTLQCDSDDNGVWYYNITHVKASHPIFDCADGCTPLPTSVGGTTFYLSKEGIGKFGIDFPNGAHISPFNYGGQDSLKVSPGGKKIEISLPGGDSRYSTGWLLKPGVAFINIETYNCIQLGGEGTCTINYIDKNTMYLTKIS